MKNAFTVLGATPYDDIERMNELLEENQLISDDDIEVQEAYTELTNPKKRIAQELIYFAGGLYSSFEAVASGTIKEKPTIGEAARMIVDLGKWFDGAKDSLLEKVNEARAASNFANIDDTFLQQALDVFFSKCVDLAQIYFDRLKENSLAGIFNSIVKIKGYGSFFIDELMAKYEATLKETLSEKEKNCMEAFNGIEQICNRFNRGYSLDSNLGNKITSFATALKIWDRYAQPLQVNAQQYGGQHEESSELVRSIRNKIIDLCNRSQEALGKMIEQVNMYSFQARELLPEKLSDSVEFTTQLIRLNDILLSVFAELEIIAEQLKKDKQSLRELLDTISGMNDKIQRVVFQRENQRVKEQLAEEETKKYSRIAQGIFAVVSFIIMIIGFSVGNLGLGIGFLFLAFGFGCCCGFYEILTKKEAKKWIIIPAIIIAFILLAVLS